MRRDGRRRILEAYAIADHAAGSIEQYRNPHHYDFVAANKGFDYLLKVRVTDMESYRRFLGDRIAAVRGVQQTHTFFVMEEVKSTHRIVVPE